MQPSIIQRKKMGGRLRAARLKAGVTAEVLAMSIGITRQQLSRIENGTSGTSVGVIRSVAAELGVTETWLVNGGKMPKVEEQKVIAGLRRKIEGMTARRQRRLLELLESGLLNIVVGTAILCDSGRC